MRRTGLASILALAATCALCAFVSAQDKPEKEQQVEVLSIEITCNGFPGTDQSAKTQQRILAASDKLLIEDQANNRTFIMRGDIEKVWEIDTKQKLYLESGFSHLKKLLGYGPGDSTQAAGRKTGEEKEINGFKCYRFQIPCKDGKLFDLWLTKDFSAPASLLSVFYRYSPAASELGPELAGVADFPVVIKAHMEFGLLERTVECEVKKVEKKTVPASAFELPEGLKKGLEAFVIEQVCNGFPGTNQKDKTKQMVCIVEDKMFMQNLEAPNTCIVRGDKQLIWEISPVTREYVERHFSYLAKLQEDNRAQRELAVRQLNRMSAERRAKNAEKLGLTLDDDGMVPDRPIVEKEVAEEEKEIGGLKCYNLKIRQDASVPLDLWLTRELGVPKSLISFYEKLGCFPEEVVAKMKDIKDFPLLLTASLNFGTAAIPVECKVTGIGRGIADPKIFELPEELTLVKRYSDKGMEIYDADCVVCGKKVNPQAKGDDAPIRHSHTPYLLFFCSQKCRSHFFEILTKNKGDIEKTLQELAKERAKNQGK
jgi:hypothetical protein